MSSSYDRTGLALMFATIVVWAGSWVAMKWVVPYIGPFDFVAVRYLSGSAVLFALLAMLRRPLSMPSWGLTLCTGLTQTAAFQFCVQTALVTGAVGTVSLLAYTMPFWVVVFAWALLGDKPGPRHFAGFFLAGAGLVCFIAPWGGMGDIAAVLLAAGGGLCWGLGTVLSKRMFNRHAPDLMTFTAWQMLMGGAASVPVALWAPQAPVQWTWQLGAGMLYIVLIATAAGWLLWLSVVRRVPASIAALSSLGVPVMATLLAWLMLGERPAAAEIGGMALILAGLWVVSGAGRRPA